MRGQDLQLSSQRRDLGGKRLEDRVVRANNLGHTPAAAFWTVSYAGRINRPRRASRDQSIREPERRPRTAMPVSMIITPAHRPVAVLGTMSPYPTVVSRQEHRDAPRHREHGRHVGPATFQPRREQRCAPPGSSVGTRDVAGWPRTAIGGENAIVTPASTCRLPSRGRRPAK